MKITKGQLRKLILEEKNRLLEMCGECAAELEAQQPAHGQSGMPCPIETAKKMKEAGASNADLANFVGQLIAEFGAHHSAHQVLVDDEFSFTGDVGELPGDEAFGVGYEAGSQGL